jgi:hypothetical protein
MTEAEFIDRLLAEYPDERTKEACDRCEQCGPVAMCSFHSILAVLDGSVPLADGVTFRPKQSYP